MRRYEFDFHRTTLTELEQCRAGTFEEVCLLYDRIVVGGIRHLSLNEIAYVVAPQFKRALDEWMQYGQMGDVLPPKPQVYDTPRIDDDAVSDMLDGIDGL